MPKTNSFLYCVLYPIHAIAWIGTLTYLIFFNFTWANALEVLIGWILIEGLGVAVG